MIKNLFLISAFIFLFSCSNWSNKEIKKSIESSAASERINSSESNNENIFKELNE